LEDDLEWPSAEGCTKELVTIAVLLVSTDLEVREETLDGFVECDSVLQQLVVFKIIFEVRRRECTPVHVPYSTAGGVAEVQSVWAESGKPADVSELERVGQASHPSGAFTGPVPECAYCET